MKIAWLSIMAWACVVPVAASALESSSCRVDTGRYANEVVELYTSEGCNSCPPADQWLSTFKSAPGAVALAFHVDYWDRLGWKDRFASPAWSQRQMAQQAVNGARFSYTPQVVLNGVDRVDWSTAARSGRHEEASVSLTLTRVQDEFVVAVRPGAGAPRRLAGYWALTEQGHVSAVKSGENNGATLHHDFVVRELQAVPDWQPGGRTEDQFRYRPGISTDSSHQRQIDFVVLDAATGRPLQAVQLGC